ncbi:two-component sensor histidine kinase [Paenibacillus abyssi]|uniref:Two-component sensor histidine kinase n=2 Tax=Paenibacillus abyssi TaxID=1340531 RepID=A0A917CTX5_9BACL|nr:two-component sensor histidine kinase [Paenibacillus abyssi]
MKRLRLNSFGAQLFLWFLLSTMALLAILSGLFYRYTTQQIDLRVGEAAERNVSQALESFSLLARSYDSLTKSVMNNVEIQRMISVEETNPAAQFQKELTIMGALGMIMYSYNDVKGIHIITNSGHLYNYQTVNYPINEKFLQSDWYEKLGQTDGTMVWGGILDEPLTLRDDKVFTFGRVIRNLYNRQPLGVLLVEADPQALISSMNNLIITPQSRTFVYSANNRLLVSSSADDEFSEELTDLSHYTFRNHASVISDSSHMIVTGREPWFGWKLLNLTPKPVAQVEQEKANRYFIILIGTLLLIVIVLATFLSRSVSKPIKTIVHEMRRVERGDLETQLDAVKSYDEINYLNNSFNRMIGEINQLVERVRIAAASEKNAQIHALQSQVNPHFLYNTLEMIYWMLDERRDERLANLVLSLSRMFRYSSDWRSSFATLGQELEQINHYMTIIRARSDGRIDIELSVAEELLQNSMPKMTLQPLIENAVIHGLTDYSEKGLIRIHTTEWEEGQTLCIHIHDNGKGMSGPKLRELQNALKRAEMLEWNQLAEEEERNQTVETSVYGESARSGAGMINVHRRLVLEYGSGYGLQIQSEENAGTTVTVIIPVLKQQ